MSCLRGWSISRMKRCRHDREHALAAVRPHPQQESSTRAFLANRRRSQVQLRNGHRGNSRSRRSRVQRIRGRKKSSTLPHGKVQILLSTTICPGVAVTDHAVVLHASDNAQRPRSGDCAELSSGHWCRGGASCFGTMSRMLVSDVEWCCTRY